MRAFSFCVYGPQSAKYHGGMLENLKTIQKHFPDWVVYVYLGNDTISLFVAKLLRYRQVRLRHVGTTGPILMMHRFLAIDDPDVELMVVRDADSRVHMRDRWAIEEFVKSDKKAHSIRDHPYHFTQILGGLWGLKRGIIPSMGELVRPHLEELWCFGKDQFFLKEEVFPLVENELLVHTSQLEQRFSDEETLVAFPWDWSEAMYCGKAENLPSRFNFLVLLSK